MNQEAKLEALMQKAIDGGLKSIPYNGDKIYVSNAKAIVDDIFDGHDQPDLFTVIFSKDFVHSVFGDTPLIMNGFQPKHPQASFAGKTEIEGVFKARPKLPYWQGILIQAVLSDDPVDAMYTAAFGK